MLYNARLRAALLVGVAAAASVSGCAQDQTSTRYDASVQGEAFPPIMDGGPRPMIQPVAPRRVRYANHEAANTIVVDSDSKKLYLTLGPNEAYEYPISVGREGFTWSGSEKISRIADWPDWHPPAEMRARDPKLPEKMYGGIKNPLGAKALFLGNTLYRIHGTNDPKTIGYAASSGCIRMLNEHVVHLAGQVGIGTTVRVMASKAGPVPAVSNPEVLPWQSAAKPKARG